MTLLATRAGRYRVLQLAMPGEMPVNAGILLEDAGENRLHIRMRRDWELIAPDEAEVLEALEADLAAKAAEMGAERFLGYLDDALSNAVLVSEPREVMVEDFDRALARLYREHVDSRVQKFVTHLPRYSIAAAAGRFLENPDVTAEGWEEAPADLKLTPEMFVAHIAGHSMEPKIPDGSLCVFRHGVAGSRHGRLVLVERLGGGSNDRYAVKRYRSEKKPGADGSWSARAHHLAIAKSGV